MNKIQAEKNGYRFSGIYDYDKEVVKAKAKEERAKGNKAVTVHEKGHRRDGYSVYIIESEENIKLGKISRLEIKINARERKIEELKAELKKEQDFHWEDVQTLVELKDNVKGGAKVMKVVRREQRDQLEGMKWNGLRQLGKDLGIKVFGMKRDSLENEIMKVRR